MPKASIGKLPALTYIEWEDAGVIDGGDWLTLEEVRDQTDGKRYLNRSIGWVVYETKTLVVIASQLAVDDPPRYDLVNRVPKSLIRKRKEVQI
jgi:hypothetical protein